MEFNSWRERETQKNNSWQEKRWAQSAETLKHVYVYKQNFKFTAQHTSPMDSNRPEWMSSLTRTKLERIRIARKWNCAFLRKRCKTQRCAYSHWPCACWPIRSVGGRFLLFVWGSQFAEGLNRAHSVPTFAAAHTRNRRVRWWKIIFAPIVNTSVVRTHQSKQQRSIWRWRNLNRTPAKSARKSMRVCVNCSCLRFTSNLISIAKNLVVAKINRSTAARVPIWHALRMVVVCVCVCACTIPAAACFHWRTNSQHVNKFIPLICSHSIQCHSFA